MIRSKDLIPQIYNTSLDFTLFEAILDTIYSEAFIGCDKLKGLHSPRQCFTEDLYKLSNLFELSSSNRQLLKVYRLMLKSKGSEEACLSAIKYCGVELNAIQPHPLGYTFEEGTLTFYTKSLKNFNSKLFDILKKTVFPVGLQVKFEVE